MKLPISWLREFVPVTGSAAQLAADFTAHGFEAVVESEDRLEVVISYNRGDCLSIYGLAREYAAWHDRLVTLPELAEVDPIPTLPDLELRLLPEAILSYTAARLESFSRELPRVVNQRIELMGGRLIHPVVDATNYVMWELGHPLHIFDYDRLTQKTIIVREAKKGEKIISRSPTGEG